MLIERLKLFVGGKEEGTSLANEDSDQFTVRAILAWKGDPEVRTTMEFETEFEDGDIVWKVWDQDLSGTVQFEQYCTDNAELQLLLLTVKNAKREAK